VVALLLPLRLGTAPTEAPAAEGSGLEVMPAEA
jgi:hypothetical protein